MQGGAREGQLVKRPQDGGDSAILEERRGEGGGQAGQEALAMSGWSWILFSCGGKLLEGLI